MIKILKSNVSALILFLLMPLQASYAASSSQESIEYSIKPAGVAHYMDLGLTDLEGSKVNLTIFKTQVMGFKDTEKIYSDPQTHLPIKVERFISNFLKKEYIIEEYDQKNFQMTVSKFKGKRRISQEVISAKGPIYNAILVPFYVRTMSGMKIGSSLVFRVPEEFETILIGKEDLVVAGKKFSSYHFTSKPHKFEIWISADQSSIPLKIKSTGGIGLTLILKEHKNSPAH